VEKNNKKITSDQGDLFQKIAGHEPGYISPNAPELDIELDFMVEIKKALRESKKHGLSRERIIERMNLCLPESLHITKRQLDAWCAESKEYHHFPAIYLPAFIWATRGMLTPIKVIAESISLVVLDENEQTVIELGQEHLNHIQALNKIRALKKKFNI